MLAFNTTTPTFVFYHFYLFFKHSWYLFLDSMRIILLANVVAFHLRSLKIFCVIRFLTQTKYMKGNYLSSFVKRYIILWWLKALSQEFPLGVHGRLDGRSTWKKRSCTSDKREFWEYGKKLGSTKTSKISAQAPFVFLILFNGS